MSHKFSVLISVHMNENEVFFDSAMRSIWDDQLLKPNQIVLVVDGLVDNPIENVIRDCIRRMPNVLEVVYLKVNVGLAEALNTGLKYCKFDYVARMDSDDISLPNRFEEQLDLFMRSPNIDIIGSSAIEIDAYGTKGSCRRVYTSHADIYNNLFLCPLIHPTVIFRKVVITEVGSFDQSLRRRQDYDLWFRCAKAGAVFANVSSPLVLYRFSSATHRKQTFKHACMQGGVGFRGVLSLNQPIWKGLICYFPALRSLLPNFMQHLLYRIVRQAYYRIP